MLTTDRLFLRQWTDADRAPFAAIMADPEVMHDYAAPWTRDEADQKLDRYRDAIARLGFGKWAVERRSDGALLGYVGVAEIFPELPIYPGLEIGWRLGRAAWGAGFASEAAAAALGDVFARTDAAEVLSFTSPGNERSLAVMRRLGLERSPERDFIQPNGLGGPAIVYRADRCRFV